MSSNEKEKTVSVSVRFDEETHKKLKYVAQYDGRSLNSELLYLAKLYIRKFERDVEKIEIE